MLAALGCRGGSLPPGRSSARSTSSRSSTTGSRPSPEGTWCGVAIRALIIIITCYYVLLLLIAGTTWLWIVIRFRILVVDSNTVNEPNPLRDGCARWSVMCAALGAACRVRRHRSTCKSRRRGGAPEGGSALYDILLILSEVSAWQVPSCAVAACWHSAPKSGS